MGLSQQKVGHLFARCDSAEETEEVLQAYAFSKWTNGGNQKYVLRKLHLLTLYLRAINLGSKLRDHYQAFAIVATLTKTNDGPIVLLPSTVVGLEAWNAARRPSSSLVKRAFNRQAMHVVTPASPGHSSNASDVDLALEVDRERGAGAGGGAGEGPQGGFSGWLAAGGRRSRSNTATVTAVVLAPGERTEQQRRAAGAGNGLLGTGLLSAPPNYDPRALAGYVESNPSLRLSTRADYDDPEADSLPDYS
ncbi:uncharacterized protein RHOBADRAFT_55498 [Rhodotorula graminis WP1]|uniref:Uncharacterized protein n=1 Tax=Rhodotorula graminis (strain WP1) TaxID=578459 RepID=A0A0P9F014_RHOGW|nr:uncharacterized protein RHOBADRAFT_55498 [Rhodotorula graminis WP1]KPV72819.1 hypothetical protein RHOBADRAFT_55498 [Rhodotorula graminis WP1]